MSVPFKGLHFDEAAPVGLIAAVVEVAISGQRVHVSYGDPETGRLSLESDDNGYGYIGRSADDLGPLLLPTRRSKRGYPLDESNIVRIREPSSGKVLWQHPTYCHDAIYIRPCEPVVEPEGRVLMVQIDREGQMHQQFENITLARRYCNKLGLNWTEEPAVFPPASQRKVKRRSAKSLVRAVRDGKYDCDSALEEHLHENYRGSLTVSSIEEVHLALCYFNMGWQNRVLDVGGDSMTVAEVVNEFGLKPFLPLFDRHEEAAFRKGDQVRWGAESWEYVGTIIGRRAVTPFAVPRFDEWEVFIESLDGESVGFVSESEVERVRDGEAVQPDNSPTSSAEDASV